MWVVHPMAAIALAMYMGVVWQKGFDGDRRAALVAALMMMLAVLGAGWVAHAGAGVSLFAAFALSAAPFSKHRVIQSVRVLATTAAFGIVGAHWVFLPLVVAGAITAIKIRGHRDRGVQLTKKPVNAMPIANPQQAPWPPQHSSQPAPMAQTLTALAQHPRLPSESAKRARALNLQCFEALAYIDERGPAADQMRFEVEQIHQNFALEAINAYLVLPPARANTAVLQDGKTGQDLLNEQLDLLSDGVHAVMQRAEELSTEQILASHAFVQQKFSHQRSELQL